MINYDDFTDNRLFEKSNTLKGENLQLSVANEKLRCEAASGGGTGTASVAGGNAALEARLLAHAEELTTLHRRRGDDAQKIVELNGKLQDVTKELQSKESRYGVNHDSVLLQLKIQFFICAASFERSCKRK